MAFHARLDMTAVEGLVRRFGIEDVAAFSVMDGGSENTNYVQCVAKRFFTINPLSVARALSFLNIRPF